MIKKEIGSMEGPSSMLQKADTKRTGSPPNTNSDKQHTTCLKERNYLETGDTRFLKVPKRKLSVFHRSFDVIVPMNQEGERETIQVRRSSSSPSVQAEETLKEKQVAQQVNSFTDDVLENYSSLIETSESTSSSSAKHLNDNIFSTVPKLPRVREDTIVQNYDTTTKTWIGRHFEVPDARNEKFQEANKVANNCRESHSTSNHSSLYSVSCEETENAKPWFSTSSASNSEAKNLSEICINVTPSHATSLNDPVQIKDLEYPRSSSSAWAADRLETSRKRSVGLEMSSREDSSIGSDSEDDSMERTLYAPCISNEAKRSNEKQQPESNFSSLPLSSTPTDVSRKPCLTTNHVEEKTEHVVRINSKGRKQQRFLGLRRSLSEGDSSGCDHARCHRKHIDRKVSVGEQEEQFQVFPSLTDSRLRATGLCNATETGMPYRENLPENELERKYIAFSIGLSTDRMTLHKRMALSLRQRDLSERNFACEIQRMQQNIQELSPLCTDSDSIERVERVRHQLDMVARCAHRVSCAAETLGAMHQEHRISTAVLIADRYLQILRSRCENLAAEVAETKRILSKNNILIEENSGQLADDLPRTRYRSGLPSNNRILMARRRASIATISRPVITSQDVIKESPKQRNSVSGRVTIRRPSLCFETQKWENEKLNRTDSSSSVGELRDIFEQAESRRNSFEENNNILRVEQPVHVDAINCAATSVVEEQTWLMDKQDSFLESNTPNSVGKELKFRIRSLEYLRITRNLMEWQLPIWCVFTFFLGFYVKHVVSAINKEFTIS